MDNRLKDRLAYVKGLLKKTKMPRNQISAISGLTNTYIRDLEKGNIANVGREKLISLAVALNLDLMETDEMLTYFDRAKLTRDDIPIFLETSNQRKISAALHPLRDLFIYELLVLTVEQSSGPLAIVSDRPSTSLRPEGHRTYTDRHSVEGHPIYGELVEAIGKERKRHLAINLAHYPLDHYICKGSLEEYIKVSLDKKEKEWRVKHVESLLWYVSNYENFRLFLTNVSSSFIFSLKKHSSKSDKERGKLIFMSRAAYNPIGQRAGRLTGFVTDNRNIIQNFKEELESIKGEVIEEYLNKQAIEEYLETLINSSKDLGRAN